MSSCGSGTYFLLELDTPLSDTELVERIKKTEVALFETDLDIFGAVKAFLGVE